MKSFLQQTAEHYAPQNLSRTMFIVPSRRAIVHLRSEFGKLGYGSDDKRMPRMQTISSFIGGLSGKKPADRITLLNELYGAYCSVKSNPETMDEFIFWGEVMLGDFNDADKYMVNPDALFVNTADFLSVREKLGDILTENQMKAVEQFVAHFRDDKGRLTVNLQGGDGMKERFLDVWNGMAPLYKAFRERLAGKGLAYEGMLSREAAEAVIGGMKGMELAARRHPYTKRFVFVGLNVLTESEKVILDALRDEGAAEFVWDFSSKEIRHPDNKASLFLSKNTVRYPSAFVPDADGLGAPVYHVVSVPSAVGQTKLIPQILSLCGGRPEETAVVLPDESLLMPLLSAVPETVGEINVTMGYPLSQSAVYSLIKAATALPLRRREKNGTVYYHHSAIEQVASSSLLRCLLTGEENALLDRILREARTFFPEGDLAQGDTLAILFRALPDGEPEEGQPRRGMARYLADLLCRVTEREGEGDLHRLETVFAAAARQAVDRLDGMDIPVGDAVWTRLLDRLLAAESLPFEGDALEGLQVMGPLETRSLDYRNVVILSANEDSFPRRSTTPSFVPPELRKGFGMPTAEMQDALWAYYFYRLVQRAENVWMVYDSRTDGLHSGEESRFIKQLEYHFHAEVHRHTAAAAMETTTAQNDIPKTQEHIDRLRSGHLSASTLQSYLSCQAKFYYQAVEGLRSRDEAVDSLDAAMLGNVFHGVMESLYSGRKTVTKDEIKTLLADKDALKALIRSRILSEMNTIEVGGRNLIVEAVLLEYVIAALRHDLHLLEGSGRNEFRILGLEKYMETEIDGFKVIGFADRIDSYKEGEVRIVDYKTGHVENDDIAITDRNAEAVADKLFGESNSGRPKIALQLYLYDRLARDNGLSGKDDTTTVNSIYSTAALMRQPLKDYPESEAFTKIVDERLSGLLKEVSDTSSPWRRTADKQTCAMCDFRAICGR